MTYVMYANVLTCVFTSGGPGLMTWPAIGNKRVVLPQDPIDQVHNAVGVS